MILCRWDISGLLAKLSLQIFGVKSSTPLAKCWLFSQTQPGARASANLYTLIEAAGTMGSSPMPICAELLKNCRWPEPSTILTHYCPARSRVGILGAYQKRSHG
jgi:hypothetical protein